MLTKITIFVVAVFILFLSFAIGFFNSRAIEEEMQEESFTKREAIEGEFEKKAKVLGVSFQKESVNYLPLSEKIVSVPIKNLEVSEIEIKAKAAIVVDIATKKILYQKNIAERLPIASLTKLMTTLVVLDEVNLEDVVTISKKAVETEGERGNLSPGEKITVRNLLYLLLVQSSNDAAVALAEYVGEKIISSESSCYSRNEFETGSELVSESIDEMKECKNQISKQVQNDSENNSISEFVKLMNKKARLLGLKNTHFVNSSGLTPVEDVRNDNIRFETKTAKDKIDKKGNYSTVYDLSQLTNYALNELLIWEILRTQEIDVQSADKRIVHHLENTNELLGKLPNIVGGKTGYTEESGQSLILVIGDPINNHQIISVVLNAEDRFAETKKLIEWIFRAYSWK